jgi:Na+-transporting methylmalonyl-CoA/oxaloacetate decarboxylase gamma subunit
MTLLAVGMAVVFCVLSLLHVAWAVGIRVGHATAIPVREDGEPTFHPGPASTFAVAGLLFVAALLVTQRVGLGRGLIPAALVVPGCWVLAAAFVLRAIGEFHYVGFFKRVRATAFARMDTRYYSPLALLLGISAALVAYYGS